MDEITKNLLDALKELLAQTGINGSFADNAKAAIAKAESALAAPQPSSDGWIPWEGSPLPDGTKHFVRLRDGEEIGPDDDPGGWFWGNDGAADNIIAYRVVKP